MKLEQFNEAKLIVDKIRDIEGLIRKARNKITILVDDTNIANKYDVTDVQEDIINILEEDLHIELKSLEKI